MEIWASIPSLPGYEASTHGNIRSLPKITRKGIRLIKPHKSPAGYLCLTPSINGETFTRLVHRLIAETFIPNPDNLPMVNHKNGIKTDCRASNLEWCTPSENQLHSIKTGLRSTVGEKNSQATLLEIHVCSIRYSTLRPGQLAKLFNVSPSTISDIKKRRSWTHL